METNIQETIRMLNTQLNRLKLLLLNSNNHYDYLYDEYKEDIKDAIKIIEKKLKNYNRIYYIDR